MRPERTRGKNGVRLGEAGEQQDGDEESDIRGECADI